jgi:hypothetical protein
MRFHAANLVGHLFDTLFCHGAPNGVGDLFDASLFHHPAGGAAHIAANLRAFLERAARTFAFISNALLIHIGAAYFAGHRIRYLFLANLFLGPANGVGNPFDLSLFHHSADRVRHFLYSGYRNFLADGIRYFLMNAFLHVSRAGNLFANGPAFRDLACADSIGVLASGNAKLAMLVIRLAGARVKAAFAASPFQTYVSSSRHAEFFGYALTDFPLNGLARLHRFAHRPHAIPIACFRYGIVSGAAHILVAGFGHRLANGAAHIFVAGLRDGPADRIATLANVLFANALLNHVASLVAMLLVNRFAHGIAAFLVAGFRDFAAYRVAALFPAGLVYRPADGFLHGLVACFVAIFVASFAFFTVAGLADLLHHRFLNRLVAGVPALFQHLVIH